MNRQICIQTSNKNTSMKYTNIICSSETAGEGEGEEVVITRLQKQKTKR